MSYKANKPIVIWLLTGCLLVFLMVVIGGITRLTHSGLSMVDWRLFMGAIPPLNEQQWLETFEKYKQFPEYQQVNFTFTLDQFKSIFFWEYLHRLIGRILGIVFFIPFIYFLFRKSLSTKLIGQCLIMMGMGAFQGFLGWWMVKSGLVKDPDVSHYRLAIHLVFALLTSAYIFSVVLQLIYPTQEGKDFRGIRRALYLLLVLTLIQITYGAFVAGLNAGFVMNTWPKMGNAWIDASVTAMTPLWKNFLEGVGGVQFVHRYLAYIIVAVIIFLKFRTRAYALNTLQKNSLNVLLGIVAVQFLLGIFTLLYSVPVILGVLHQAGAFFLLGALVFSLHSYRKKCAR